MSVSNEFLEFVRDQLSELGDIKIRKMFGGAGLYYEGLMFALVADDMVYLKVDDATRGKYVKLGSLPLMPFPNRTSISSFLEVPTELFLDSEEFVECATESLRIQMKLKDISL